MNLRFLFIAFLLLSCLTKSGLSQNCIESNKWKYEDYTKKPLFANQIFTKGYGVFIYFRQKDPVSKELKDSLTNIITNGFRTALTNWGVSLIMNKETLSPEIKKYLDDYSFKSGGNYTYNAPNVFTVDCIENANFVFQVYFKKGEKFRDKKSILAKAQVRGRTIILNMQKQKIVYNQRFFDVVKDNSLYNIVPIIAHELGHCFGLVHDTSGKSIMSPYAINMANFPTKNDGKNFAAILSVALKGTEPGYFNPTECMGLFTRRRKHNPG